MGDFIVAIDLGTSHLTGIVGEKNENGTFSIIACETEDTVSGFQKGEADDKISCIHRGLIYNRDSTAVHIGNLLLKLETQLKGDTIEKVYVGIGGQSLRSIDHIEALEISDGAAVTEEDIAFLKDQCSRFKPDLADVLDMAPAVYYLDGRKDTQPVGVSCKRLEAHYKLIIGRSSIRHEITKSIEKIPGKSLAGIFVSPLALADAMLSPKEKELGCALIDFGAGVTTVSVYEDGDLKSLCVIPLGSKLITGDITSLKLTVEEAERLKIEKGDAILNKEDEDKHFTIKMDGGEREVRLSDLNAIIEGRAREIVENVYTRICDVIEPRQLGSGIVLAGCGAELTNLHELLHKKCNVNVRFSAVRKGLASGFDDLLGNPLYMMAISLMLKGTAPCVIHHDAVYPDIDNPVIPLEIEKEERRPRKKEEEKKKIDIVNAGKKIPKWFNNLFTEE